MGEKKTYVCPLCGAEHDTPKAMAHCVLECEEKQRAEAERLRRQQLDQEQDKRWNEVVAAWDTYRNLYRKFTNDKFTNDYPVFVWKTSPSLWNMLTSL